MRPRWSEITGSRPVVIRLAVRPPISTSASTPLICSRLPLGRVAAAARTRTSIVILVVQTILPITGAPIGATAPLVHPRVSPVNVGTTSAVARLVAVPLIVVVAVVAALSPAVPGIPSPLAAGGTTIIATKPVGAAVRRLLLVPVDRAAAILGGDVPIPLTGQSINRRVLCARNLKPRGGSFHRERLPLRFAMLACCD